MTPGLDHIPPRRWHALWTRPHGVRIVGHQLRSQGFQVFNPEVPAWSWRGGVRRASTRPLFPGYVFVKHEPDRESGSRAIVRYLSERWDRLFVVPDREIEAIRRVLDAALTPLPHPYVSEGPRVTIRRGPLAGVEGILLETRPNRGLLVLSIDLFRRSVAVSIDRALAAHA